MGGGLQGCSFIGLSLAQLAEQIILRPPLTLRALVPIKRRRRATSTSRIDHRRRCCFFHFPLERKYFELNRIEGRVNK